MELRYQVVTINKYGARYQMEATARMCISEFSALGDDITIEWCIRPGVRAELCRHRCDLVQTAVDMGTVSDHEVE